MKRRRLAREAARQAVEGPVTVRYPAERLPLPEGFRGHIHVSDEGCIGCSKCDIVCPTACIEMVDDAREVEHHGRTFTRKRKPVVHLFDCIRCGLCEDVCPTEPKSIYLTPEFAGASTSKREVVR